MPAAAFYAAVRILRKVRPVHVMLCGVSPRLRQIVHRIPTYPPEEPLRVRMAHQLELARDSGVRVVVIKMIAADPGVTIVMTGE